MLRRLGPISLVLAAALAACAHEELVYRTPPATLAAIAPAGGSASVDPANGIVVSFSLPLEVGMERFAALHRGDITGEVAAGTWSLSADATALTFTPATPLARGALYTVHLGGGLKDANGRAVDLSPGLALGGRWATAEMMDNAPPGSPALAMIGQGWLAPNGTYGMLFGFTTS